MPGLIRGVVPGLTAQERMGPVLVLAGAEVDGR